MPVDKIGGFLRMCIGFWDRIDSCCTNCLVESEVRFGKSKKSSLDIFDSPKIVHPECGIPLESDKSAGRMSD